MRLHSLTARSFLAFKEPVTLNLDDIGPGLVALVGENGSGKSTLLELLYTVLYRNSPSRKSNLPDLVHGERDAFVEAAFTNGDQYRAKLLINGHARKMEAYLTQDGDPVVSGRCPEYDAAVLDRFGPAELWLASILSAQKHTGDFLKAPRSERKAIFAELLGLAELQQHHETAKAAGNIYTTRLSLLRMKAKDLDERLEEKPDLIKMDTFLRGIIKETKESIATVDAQAKDADARLAELRRSADVVARAVALKNEIAGLVEDHGKANLELSQARVSATNAKKQARSRHEGLIADEGIALTARKKDTAARIRVARAGLESAPEIQEAARLVSKLDAEIPDQQTMVDEAQRTVKALQADVKKAMQDESESRTQAEKLTRMVQDAATLNHVPCDAVSEPYSDCQYLKRGLEAKAALPEQEAAMVEIEQTRDSVLALDESLTGAQDIAEGFASEIRRMQKQRTDLQGLAVQLSGLSGLTDSIVKAEADLSADEEQSSARIRRSAAELDESNTTTDDNLERLTRDIDDRMARINTQLRSKQVDYDEMHAGPDDNIELQIDVTSVEVSQLSLIIDEHRAKLETFTSDLGATTARLEAITTATREKDSLKAEMSTAASHAADWGLLAKACGKDGIQALEIDAAGPEVTGIANELLAGCYGTRFQIRFETTAAKKGGGQKEVFDVRILDDGQERIVEDLSGGQEVIIREAISLALAIFHSRRSGRRFETLFRDETAGALDPDHAQRYVLMLRQALAVGGFHQLLFVSHAPEVWEQADAKVHVADGAVSVS